MCEPSVLKCSWLFSLKYATSHVTILENSGENWKVQSRVNVKIESVREETKTSQQTNYSITASKLRTCGKTE